MRKLARSLAYAIAALTVFMAVYLSFCYVYESGREFGYAAANSINDADLVQARTDLAAARRQAYEYQAAAKAVQASIEEAREQLQAAASAVELAEVGYRKAVMDASGAIADSKLALRRIDSGAIADSKLALRRIAAGVGRSSADPVNVAGQ